MIKTFNEPNEIIIIDPELDLPSGYDVRRGIHSGGNNDFAGDWVLMSEANTVGVGFSIDNGSSTLLIEDPPRWSEMFEPEQRPGNKIKRIEDGTRMNFLNILAYIADKNGVDSISTHNLKSLEVLLKGRPQYYWTGLLRVFEELSAVDDGEYISIPVVSFL